MTTIQHEECFAVPGETMIDVIDSATGRTVIYGKTLADCQRDYPGAERMSIDAYCQSKAQAQDTPITWAPTTEDRYSELLECLPPAAYRPGGFLVGEPWDHHAITGAPRYQACIHKGTSYFISNRAMTKAEFMAVEI